MAEVVHMNPDVSGPVARRWFGVPDNKLLRVLEDGIKLVSCQEFYHKGVRVSELVLEMSNDRLTTGGVVRKLLWSRAPFAETLVGGQLNPFVHSDWKVSDLGQGPPDRTLEEAARRRVRKTFDKYYRLPRDYSATQETDDEGRQEAEDEEGDGRVQGGDPKEFLRPEGEIQDASHCHRVE